MKPPPERHASRPPRGVGGLVFLALAAALFLSDLHLQGELRAHEQWISAFERRLMVHQSRLESGLRTLRAQAFLLRVLSEHTRQDPFVLHRFPRPLKARLVLDFDEVTPRTSRL